VTDKQSIKIVLRHGIFPYSERRPCHLKLFLYIKITALKKPFLYFSRFIKIIKEINKALQVSVILKYAKSGHPEHSAQLAAVCTSVSRTHADMRGTPSPQLLPQIFKSHLKCYFPHTKGKVRIPYHAVCSIHIAFFLVKLVTTLSKSLSFNICPDRKTGKL